MTGPVLMTVDTLLDADDRAHSGCVVPVPCQRVDGGRLALFPRPRVRTDDAGHPVAVELDLAAWLVSIAPGVTLPLECHHQRSAQAVAEAFAADVARGRIDPQNPEHITGWSRWWAEFTTDAHLIA